MRSKCKSEYKHRPQPKACKKHPQKSKLMPNKGSGKLEPKKGSGKLQPKKGSGKLQPKKGSDKLQPKKGSGKTEPKKGSDKTRLHNSPPHRVLKFAQTLCSNSVSFKTTQKWPYVVQKACIIPLQSSRCKPMCSSRRVDTRNKNSLSHTTWKAFSPSLVKWASSSGHEKLLREFASTVNYNYLQQTSCGRIKISCISYLIPASKNKT